MGCNQAKASSIDNVIIDEKPIVCVRDVDDDDEERAFFEAEDGKNIGFLSQSNVEILTVQRERPSDVTKMLQHRWMQHHFSVHSKKRKSNLKSKRRSENLCTSSPQNSNNKNNTNQSPRSVSLPPDESAPDFLEVGLLYTSLLLMLLQLQLRAIYICLHVLLLIYKSF